MKQYVIRFLWEIIYLIIQKTVAMSIVGYAAAVGIFLDIHPFLRGLAQCLQGPDGPGIQLSREMQDEVERMTDPDDPTEIVEEYYEAWWMHSKDWKVIEPPLVEVWPAIKFHTDKVRFWSMYFWTYLTEPSLAG
jgi:hypothetical protein